MKQQSTTVFEVNQTVCSKYQQIMRNVANTWIGVQTQFFSATIQRY